MINDHYHGSTYYKYVIVIPSTAQSWSLQNTMHGFLTIWIAMVTMVMVNVKQMWTGSSTSVKSFWLIPPIVWPANIFILCYTTIVRHCQIWRIVRLMTYPIWKQGQGRVLNINSTSLLIGPLRTWEHIPHHLNCTCLCLWTMLCIYIWCIYIDIC